jgi:dTDP-4-dehydrorhamnose reductase
MASSVSVVLFGATGTLGSEFARHLSADFEVISPTRSDANLASSGSVTRFLESCTFDLLINAAGWTDVDACETRPEKAMQVNALAVGEMATACKRRGARMIHFSSDYVFPGDGKDLLNEREPSAPINAYGRSKLQGERHVLEEVDNALIIRLSWLRLLGSGSSRQRPPLRRGGGQMEQPHLQRRSRQGYYPPVARQLSAGAPAL